MPIDEPVLMDTGAIVALSNRNDPDHEACQSVSQMLPVGKVYTCWPVLTEAAYLLRNYPEQRSTLLDAVAGSELQLLRLRSSDIAGVKDVFSKFSDQNVDLADAAVVHLANRENIQAVFTLDQRHFRVFRMLDGRAFRLLPYDVGE